MVKDLETESFDVHRLILDDAQHGHLPSVQYGIMSTFMMCIRLASANGGL